MARWKKYLKWTAIAVGVIVAVALIANTVAIMSYTNRFEERLQAIRDEGQPITLSQLEAEAPAVEKNAATFIARARSDIEALTAELQPVLEKDYAAGELRKEDLETIRSAFDAYPRVMPLLQKAARADTYTPDLPAGGSPNEFMDRQFDRASLHRSVAHVLSINAVWRHQQGQPDSAVESCATLFRLCRHFDREPLLISHLVTLACRSIGVNASNFVARSDELSDASRERLEVELARHDLMESFREALRTERPLGLDQYREILGRGWTWPLRTAFLHDVCTYLDVMKTSIALTEKPYREVAQAPTMPETGTLGILAGLIPPAIDEARKSTDRVRAKLGCLRVLNALRRREIDRAEQSPNLVELNLSGDGHIDPFTNKPFQLKRTEGGWLIYSVGPNLEDDGGKLESREDIGVAPIR